jgi:hypothetical protein
MWIVDILEIEPVVRKKEFLKPELYEVRGVFPWFARARRFIENTLAGKAAYLRGQPREYRDIPISRSIGE